MINVITTDILDPNSFVVDDQGVLKLANGAGS